MKFLLLLITAITFSTAFTSCSKLPTPEPAATQAENGKHNMLVYIYKTDSSDAVDFKQLMQANKCTVVLLEKTAVKTTALSQYDLIVAGHNTDVLAPAPGWTAEECTAIKQSGKPLLLMGVGGMQLAKKMGNDISLANCGFSGLTGFNVLDSASSLYKQPYKIKTNPGVPLQLYSETVSAITFYSPSETNGIALVGGDATMGEHYPLAQEGNLYSLFGFISSMNKMTATGKDFFVNYVYYAGKLSQ